MSSNLITRIGKCMGEALNVYGIPEQGDRMLKEAKRSLLMANTRSLVILCHNVTTLLNWSATSAALPLPPPTHLLVCP